MISPIAKVLVLVAALSAAQGCWKASAADAADPGAADSDSDADTDTETDTETTTATTPEDGMVFGHTYYYEETIAEVTVTAVDQSSDETLGPTSSDDDGYYELDLAPGTYRMVGDNGIYHGEVCDVVVGPGDQIEVDIFLGETDYAPYIYLYPETAQYVDVTLLPAEGTDIIASDPPYGDGWTVWAEPSGLLDGAFDFLFYEATVPWVYQTEQGWAVAPEAIQGWFATTLPQLGLSPDETADFLDYWSINLPTAPCYHVYPQDAEIIVQAMGLAVDPEPDSSLRIRLLIEGVAECEDLAEPEIENFERLGFTVVEWGVVLTGFDF
jgi:hypothetical protein